MKAAKFYLQRESIFCRTANIILIHQYIVAGLVNSKICYNWSYFSSLVAHLRSSGLPLLTHSLSSIRRKFFSFQQHLRIEVIFFTCQQHLRISWKWRAKVEKLESQDTQVYASIVFFPPVFSLDDSHKFASDENESKV